MMTEATAARRIYARLAKLLGGKAAAGVIGIAHLAIATRTLGPEGFGVLVLVSGFAMTVGGIAEFPCWHAILRYGADAQASGDEPRLLRLLRFTTLVEVAGGIVAVAATALLGHVFGARLGWSPVAIGFAFSYGFAALASIRSVPAAYLILCDRYDLVSFHTILQPIVRTIGALIAAGTGAGLHGFLIAWLVAALVEFGAMWAMALVEARRRIGLRRLWGSPRGVLAENDRLFLFMLGANADVTFGDLAARLAPLVIGWWSGARAAALFNVAQRTTVVIAQPAELFGRASYAEFASLAAAKDHATLRRALVQAVALALLVCVPLVAVVAIAGRPIATLLGGPGFAGAAPLMVWLIGAQALLLVAPPTSAALVALGRPGVSLGANMLCRFCLLPLLPVLLAGFGLIGAGAHAVLVALAVSLVLSWRLSRILARS